MGPPDGSDLPKVIASEGNYGLWVSLSHCWGSSTPFILDSTNLLERMCGITTADLPATFYDAIRVTRRLGFRFLWIDSLCIIQDSEEDWISESCLMQRYYEQASLTIASDSSFGDDQSFLHVKRSKDQNAVTIPVKLHNAFMPRLLKESSQVGQVVHIRSEVRGFHDLAFLQGHALSRRGWTLQEKFFSPRSLHYAPDQLLWECRKGKRTEGLRSMLLTGTYYRGLDLKNVCLSRTENMVMNYRWYILVESYVPRRLTFPSDRFPALSALARFVAKQTDFTYRAGIWLEDYCIGLLWFCEHLETRSDHYVAPSWSWASISTRYTHRGIAHPQRTASDFAKQKIQDKRALLVSCQVGLKGADDFGTLLSGSITLRGIYVTSRAFTSLSIGQITFLHGGYRAPGRGIPDENTVLCYFDEPLLRQALNQNYIIPSRSPISEGVIRGIYFFYVTTASHPEGDWWPEDEGNISYFLLLAPIENKGQFLRTGVAMMSVNTLLAMKAFWEVVEVTII